MHLKYREAAKNSTDFTYTYENGIKDFPEDYTQKV